MAKLQSPVKQTFDGMKSHLLQMHKGIGGFSKALDKVQTLTSVDDQAIDELGDRDSRTKRCQRLHLTPSPTSRP